MELKAPLDYEEQVKTLQKHNMTIDVNDSSVIDFFNRVNYYRFTGYALQFRDKGHNDYIDGTNFSTVKKIYEFDERLRDLLRIYLEKIEIYYRTQIAYGFSINKCKEPPYDQHYYEANFSDIQGYRKVKKSFSKEKGYYKQDLAVIHHNNKYDGKMPLWVIVELMSFSTLSKLYHSMKDEEQQIIAENVGSKSKELKNHLHCLSILRNKCAHAARLYNTEFYPPASFTKTFLRKNKCVMNNTLFAYIIIVLKRLPDIKSKDNFIIDIQTVIEQYCDDIDISIIGVPENYLEILNIAKTPSKH